MERQQGNFLLVCFITQFRRCPLRTTPSVPRHSSVLHQDKAGDACDFRRPSAGIRHYLRESPMAYLTRWRLQLGAQMLGSTNCPVAQITAEVGYESEAAFNRAFKRHFTVPPAFPQSSEI
jgi:methylphosphotriester-DNA--protein-cysteine methyltransferase